jgi:uncharacterized membrane protein YqgA involved in biofilm formation
MLFQGTLVNVAAVLVGSTAGILLGRKISAAVQELRLGALGLSSLVIGAELALGTHRMWLVIASLILGGLVGHLLRIEALLEAFGEWLKRLVAPGAGVRPAASAGSSPAEGAGFSVGKAFVTASLIFCVGPLTIMGSLQDGAAGDPTLLYMKSALDGPCSMVLTAGMGFGVVFSAASVLTVQGSLTLVGRFFQEFLTQPIRTEVLAAGGLLTIAIGLELLRIKKLPTANFLPALLFAGVGAWLLGG